VSNNFFNPIFLAHKSTKQSKSYGQTENHCSSSHCSRCRLVKYASQLNFHCKDSLIPLSQYCHCELKSWTEAFMASLNSLQINNLQSAKVHHLDCLFRTTTPYNFVTESAIKRGVIPALSILFMSISVQSKKSKLDRSMHMDMCTAYFKQ